MNSGAHGVGVECCGCGVDEEWGSWCGGGVDEKLGPCCGCGVDEEWGSWCGGGVKMESGADSVGEE